MESTPHLETPSGSVPLLAISIPTCNHPELVDQFIRAILPSLRRFQIPVYVTDNSDNDQTEGILQALTDEYPAIFYRRNTENLRFDANCAQAITWPNAEYVWPIGDGMLINESMIEPILKSLEEKPDLVFLNYRVPDSRQRVIEPSEQHEWIVNHAWHLTSLGVTIFGVRPRGIARRTSPEDFGRWKNFFHLGLILRCSTTEKSRCLWIGPHAVRGNPNKTGSGWVGIAIQVFAGDWARLILNFSDVFTPKETQELIRSHGVKTRIFGWRDLLQFRKDGRFSKQIFDAYQTEIKLAVPLPIRWLQLLADASDARIHWPSIGWRLMLQLCWVLEKIQHLGPLFVKKSAPSDSSLI